MIDFSLVYFTLGFLVAAIIFFIDCTHNKIDKYRLVDNIFFYVFCFVLWPLLLFLLWEHSRELKQEDKKND